MVLDITTVDRVRALVDLKTHEFEAKDVNGQPRGKGKLVFQPFVRPGVPLIVGLTDGVIENFGVVENVIYR